MKSLLFVSCFLLVGCTGTNAKVTPAKTEQEIVRREIRPARTVRRTTSLIVTPPGAPACVSSSRPSLSPASSVPGVSEPTPVTSESKGTESPKAPQSSSPKK